MYRISRLVSADFILIAATVFVLGGCGESTPPPLATQEAVKQNPEQKLAELKKEATAGDALSQTMLGLMYDTGKDVPQDPVKAAEWYQKAAVQGYAKAQFFLGRMYAIGEGVPRDVVKAVEWIQLAAAQGHAEAQYHASIAYELGEGVPKDAVKAMELVQKAAEQGHGEAQFDLGLRYLGREELPKDAIKAMEWFQKAAAQNHSESQYHIGWMYSTGEGVPKDSVKAVEWYQKAAAQGHAKAHNNLGVHYHKGDGVTEDRVLAYAWFNLAAASGKKDSMQARSIVEAQLTKRELAEAQRLSSEWKKGQILAREGRQESTSTAPATSGTLTKQQTGNLSAQEDTPQVVRAQTTAREEAERKLDPDESTCKPRSIAYFNGGWVSGAAGNNFADPVGWLDSFLSMSENDKKQMLIDNPLMIRFGNGVGGDGCSGITHLEPRRVVISEPLGGGKTRGGKYLVVATEIKSRRGLNAACFVVVRSKDLSCN